MVVVLGFEFVHGGEREVEREREGGGGERQKLEKVNRDGFRLYILLCRYIILMCYI